MAELFSRLTTWLAEHFRSLIGVDSSKRLTGDAFEPLLSLYMQLVQRYGFYCSAPVYSADPVYSTTMNDKALLRTDASLHELPRTAHALGPPRA